MNGLCRDLMAELLSAGAATAKDYEPGESERNAGNHPKRIVTLFGELPPIMRTYWYDADERRGHYPFDDRLGLVGRYTPAACADMIRCAVDHPFADAAKDFSAKHAFRISADTVREVVGLHYGSIRDFTKSESHVKEDSRGRAQLVCIMADGTGIPMRKECLQGAKGKDGLAKTREVKAAAIFRASTTSDNEPHRDIGTTSYVATTHRTGKFGELVRAEFDRRFGQVPETTLYITDGGKWLHKSNRLEEFFAYIVRDLRQVDCAA